MSKIPLHRSRTLPHSAAVIASLAVFALAPSAASAARCQAPPGTSGIDQYCEVIPGPAGPRTPETAGPGSPARAGVSPVPSRARNALGRAGRDGAAVVGLANGGGAQPHGTQPSKRGSPPGIGSAKGPSNNPLSAVSSAAESGATLSPGLPLALIALALLAAGYGWVRYRARRRLAASGSGEPAQ